MGTTLTFMITSAKDETNCIREKGKTQLKLTNRAKGTLHNYNAASLVIRERIRSL